LQFSIVGDWLSDMRIEHYQTVDSPSVTRLDIQVNELISAGWQPFGSPYKIADAVCQTMVLDTDAMKRMKEETQQ